MAVLDAQTWILVSPLLDAALDLARGDRAGFVAALRNERPHLADILSELLASHDSAMASSFLQDPLVPPENELAGMAVGAYVLERPIGRGGMGTVWLARRADGRYEGRVAVKFVNLSTLDDDARRRFQKEATTLARLSHPNIARIRDAGVTGGGQPYLVLDYVEGVPIDQYADEHQLDVAARLALFLQVAAAVAHAHANLVVHRDLKPSNVMVDHTGHVALLDFGIAKLLADEDGSAALTAATRHALTPAFAAPEQLTRADVTVGADVFALGTLLYLLLAGRHPAEPVLESTADLVHAITRLDPPLMSVRAVDPDHALSGSPVTIAAARRTTPARLRATLRGELETIVAKALKKAPSERYASVDALAADISRYLRHEPISARPDSAIYRLRKFARRNRVAVTAGAVAAAAILAGTAGVVLQARQSATDRDFALQQLARAEAINDMNAFLLSDAAPLGQPFTAGELLRRAEGLLNRHRTDPPDGSMVESLVSIGGQFQSRDEDENARRVLTRAFDLARKLPPEHVATRARAGCALANTLARGDLDELRRAQTLAAESIARLPAGRAFMLDRVYCERMASSVARLAGDGDADVAHAAEAKRLLQASGLGSELAALRVDMELAEAYRVSGHEAEADRVYRGAYEQMRVLGRDRTERAGTLLNNWGLTLLSLGRPLEADEAFRQAVEISQVDPSGAGVSPMLMLNAARPVLELGAADEAIAMIERARSEATRLDDQVVQLQALLLLAGAHRQRGDLDEASRLFDEAERQLRQRLPAGHTAFDSLALQRALVAQLRGHVDEARALATEALARSEASSQGADLVPVALLRRAQIGLAAGQPEQAVADARRAVEIESGRTPSGALSSRLGRMYLTLGEAQRAAGPADEAQPAIQEAARHLLATLGTEHADTRRAVELLKARP